MCSFSNWGYWTTRNALFRTKPLHTICCNNCFASYHRNSVSTCISIFQINWPPFVYINLMYVISVTIYLITKMLIFRSSPNDVSHTVWRAFLCLCFWTIVRSSALSHMRTVIALIFINATMHLDLWLKLVVHALGGCAQQNHEDGWIWSWSWWNILTLSSNVSRYMFVFVQLTSAHWQM